MAATYANKYTCSNTAAFIQRVGMALLRHCHYVFGQGANASQMTLIRLVLADNTPWATKFAKSVATEPSIDAKIEADPTGATVTDAEIESAIQSVFPAYL